MEEIIYSRVYKSAAKASKSMERHFFGLIIKTNVAYLPLKRHLFYPVFFYNINNVIIFNIFR